MPRINLVKIDAHVGRSGVWGGRDFRRGVHSTVLSAEDAEKLTPMFERFYGAVTEDRARDLRPELFDEGGPYDGHHPVLGEGNLRHQGQQPAPGPAADGGGDGAAALRAEREPAAAGGGHERPEADGRGPLPQPGEDRTIDIDDEIEDDGSINAVDRSVPTSEVAPTGQPDVAEADIDLAEAVAKLDHENDAHWTPQGFPALAPLTEMMGRNVTRKEVDGVAQGYNRTGAANASKE